MHMSLNDWKSAHPNTTCAPVLRPDHTSTGFIECRVDMAVQNGPGTVQPAQALELQGQPMTDVTYHFEGEKLLEIYGHFDPSRFATVRDAMIERLGKPSQTQFLTYRTAAGKKFPGQQVMWIRRNAIFQLDQLSGTIQTSRLMILSK